MNQSNWDAQLSHDPTRAQRGCRRIAVPTVAGSAGRLRAHIPETAATPAAHGATRRRYIGLLTPDVARRLQRFVRPFGFTIEACRADAWLQALDGPPHVCAIIDPAQLTPADLETAITRLRQHPRPVIVYADSSPASVSRAKRVMEETGGAVVVHPYEESASLLTRAIVSAVPASDAAMLLAHLEPALARLPDNVHGAITALFAPGAAPQTPELVAQRTGLSRRSLDRWLARGGFPSTRLLIAAPPMLRAFRLLTETDIPLHMVANVTGMRSAPRLRHSALELVGLRPVQIRAEGPSMAALINATAAALVRGEVHPA